MTNNEARQNIIVQIEQRKAHLSVWSAKALLARDDNARNDCINIANRHCELIQDLGEAYLGIPANDEDWKG